MPKPPTHPLVPRPPLVSGALIGIIDDDDILCSSLVDLMHSAGIRAEPFDSAETFLGSPAPLQFDCVVADVYMPGMSGIDLVRKLRERGGTAPVILITASPDRRLDYDAAFAGAQWVLRKPFEAAALVDCVEKSLSKQCPPGQYRDRNLVPAALFRTHRFPAP